MTSWYLVAGSVLILMALSSSLLKRLPLTTSLLYLVLGFVLGPSGAGMIQLDPLTQASLLEHLAEVAVIVSLFTVGLKLRIGSRDRNWLLPLRLASLSMVVTIALIAAAGMIGLGLPLGAAVLLGAILAPTDPVLASDVQVGHADDRDRLRFILTGEAGLNDGAAFPFVMLGLGLLGCHELGAGGWRWLLVDCAWAVVGGMGIGWALGALVGRLVIFLRREHREAVGLDDFLCLGLIALAYGVALALSTYGFLAVFASGLSLRHTEMAVSRRAQQRPVGPVADPAADGAAADASSEPEVLVSAVLGFTEQVERLGEVVIVVLVGALLATIPLPLDAIWFIPLLLLVIRPIAASIGCLGSRSSRTQRLLIAWFGIRGVGSLYYLMFAVGEGIDRQLAMTLTSVTLVTIAVSIVVHGISVTPLMRAYARSR